MISDIVSRVIFMAVFGFIGLLLGGYLPAQSLGPAYLSGYTIGGLVGAALGLVVGPYLTLLPAHWARKQVIDGSPQLMLWSASGLLAGLFAGALLALPLALLPDLWGRILPAISTIVLGYLGTVIAGSVWHEVSISPNAFVGARSMARGEVRASNGHKVILDTSAIIDGRIADITETGFIRDTLLIPRFVLDELRHIADSADAMRRMRGRRGLDILNKLQKESEVPIQISDVDYETVPEVDAKLVMLAKALRSPIVTGDFNLNRVAELQGVKVLNVNELANAVKPVVLPGEELSIRIIQEGKEAGQGVGFLEDGTMVVVEGGRRYLNNLISVMVTRVLQTAAGRMIFAYPK